MFVYVLDVCSVVGDFLRDDEVLVLSSCTRTLREYLFPIDVSKTLVLLSTWMPGIGASPLVEKRGHFTVSPRRRDVDVTPDGDLLAAQPDEFVLQWLSLPYRTDRMRTACMDKFLWSLTPWHPHVIWGLRAVFRCNHPLCGGTCQLLGSLQNYRLLRQASTFCHYDVLEFLILEAGMDVDSENGMPFRMVVGTAIVQPTPTSTACVALLLRAGADHSRDNFWALRILLHSRSYVLASLVYHYFLRDMFPWESQDVDMEVLEQALADTMEERTLLAITRVRALQLL